MSTNDKLREWFHEIPEEKAPGDFNRKVMQGIMAEWSKNPTAYKPIISRKAWWGVGIFFVLLTIVLFMLKNAMGVAGSTAETQTIAGINLDYIWNFIADFFGKMNRISPAVGVGALSIIALWFFDQLYTRMARHN
jgi:uncharacterized membrane protein YhaH (DUF805 family)